MDTECGDYVCIFNDDEFDMKYKNTSRCTDNKYGEEVCYEYGTKFWFFPFSFTVNCTLANIQGTFGGSGKRIDSFTNTVNCNLKGNVASSSGIQGLVLVFR